MPHIQLIAVSHEEEERGIISSSKYFFSQNPNTCYNLGNLDYCSGLMCFIELIIWFIFSNLYKIVCINLFLEYNISFLLLFVGHRQEVLAVSWSPRHEYILATAR